MEQLCKLRMSHLAERCDMHWHNQIWQRQSDGCWQHQTLPLWLVLNRDSGLYVIRYRDPGDGKIHQVVSSVGHTEFRLEYAERLARQVRRQVFAHVRIDTKEHVR